MKVADYMGEALDELRDNVAKVDNENVEKFIEMIFAAKKVYVAAAGRSRLMLNAFAMRLMHLGFRVYVVGEIVTPAVEPGDLLIVGSGSGKTESLLIMAKKAKRIGAKLAVLTIFPESEIASLADLVIQIGGRTSKVLNGVTTVQPGGNVFEQSMLILLDCMIVKIAEVGSIDITRFNRHANLE